MIVIKIENFKETVMGVRFMGREELPRNLDVKPNHLEKSHIAPFHVLKAHFLIMLLPLKIFEQDIIDYFNDNAAY